MKYKLSLCIMLFLSVLHAETAADVESLGRDAVDDIVNGLERIAEKAGLPADASAQYVEKSNALQEEMTEDLERYRSSGDEQNLVAARESLEELKKEQKKLAASAPQSAQAAAVAEKAEAGDALVEAEFDKAEFAKKVWDILRGSAYDKLRTSYQEDNPFRGRVAQVTLAEELHYNERLALSRREPIIQRGFEQFFGHAVSANNRFHLAFSGSGGGYRSMFLTLGYLRGLQKIGLLDAMQYVAGLSGSTWAIAPWIQRDKTLAASIDYVVQMAREGKLNPRSFELDYDTTALKIIVNQVLLPKLLFGQVISSVDLYGVLLARVLLGDFGNARYAQYLPNQWNSIAGGRYPFPLYASVSMHKDAQGKAEFNWYEFNPLQVTNVELDLAIPTYAFNWNFAAGKSLEAGWPANLGFLMGIWGSAFNINSHEIIDMFLDAFKKAESSGTIDKVKRKIIKIALTIMRGSPGSKARISPAQIANPFVNVPQAPAWLAQRSTITMLDAGIKFNIPLPLLARKARNIQAIIVGDSSSSAEFPVELGKALYDLNVRYNYKYQRVDDRTYANLQFYKDPNNPEAPVIIYLNFVNNPEFIGKAMQTPEFAQIVKEHNLEEFSAKCLDDFCGTFNFNYTAAQVEQLIAYATLVPQVYKPEIEAFLRQHFMIQQPAPASEETWDFY